MRTYIPFNVPKDIDPRVAEILKKLDTYLRHNQTAIKALGEGRRPDGSGDPIVDQPGQVDHGNLRGLVPVLIGTSISDYNDDHTQYPLIYGRPSGQYIYGSRDTDLLETFTAKGNLILAANYDAGGTMTSWTGMTADANSVIGEGALAVVTTRDGVATTGATNQHSALADSKGNSWTKLQEFTAQLSTVYYTVSVWTTTVTAAHVASTTTFTATFTSGVTWMAMEAFKFSLGAGLAFEKADSLTGSQTGGNPSSIVLPSNSGRTLYVRASALEAISGDPASIGWTPTNGWSDFTDDDDHTDSSSTGGSKCFQARAEWIVKTDEGVTSDPDALPVSPSETWRDASILMAVQVGVSGTGLLTLRSKNASLAASLYLSGSTIKANQDFFQWRAPGGTTTLSYIDGSDGSFNGPVVASSLSISPALNLLNTSLFGDVVAAAAVRGRIIVGNSTPKWSSLSPGANGAILKTDGTDVAWTTGGVRVESNSFGYGENLSVIGTAGVPGVVLKDTLNNVSVGLVADMVEGSFGTLTNHQFSILTNSTAKLTISGAGTITTFPTMATNIAMGGNDITGGGSFYLATDTDRTYYGAGTDAWVYFDGTDLIIDSGSVTKGSTNIYTSAPVVQSNWAGRQTIFKVTHGSLTGGGTNTTAAGLALGSMTISDATLGTGEYGAITGLDINVTASSTTKTGVPKAFASGSMYGLKLTYSVNNSSGLYTNNAHPGLWVSQTATSGTQYGCLVEITGASSGTGTAGVVSSRFTASNSDASGSSAGFNGFAQLSNASAAGDAVAVLAACANTGSSVSSRMVGFLYTANPTGVSDSRQNYVLSGPGIAAVSALYLSTTLDFRSTNPWTHLTFNTGSVTANNDLGVEGDAEIDGQVWFDYVGDALTFAEGGNIALGTTTGTKIGTATSQKLGFFNATPVAQPAALTTQLTAITHTAPGTPDYAIADLVDSGVGSAFGFSTKDEGNTVLSVIANLQTRVQELENKLSAATGGVGLIA